MASLPCVRFVAFSWFVSLVCGSTLVVLLLAVVRLRLKPQAGNDAALARGDVGSDKTDTRCMREFTVRRVGTVTIRDISRCRYFHESGRSLQTLQYIAGHAQLCVFNRLHWHARAHMPWSGKRTFATQQMVRILYRAQGLALLASQVSAINERAGSARHTECCVVQSAVCLSMMLCSEWLCFKPVAIPSHCFVHREELCSMWTGSRWDASSTKKFVPCGPGRVGTRRPQADMITFQG